MKEYDITRGKELVDKWNNDTINIEEVKELFMCLTKDTYGGKSQYNNPALLKRIKQTIDEWRKVNVDGHEIVSPLYIDANGNLAALDYGTNETRFTAGFNSGSQLTSFSDNRDVKVCISTAYGQEICFHVNGDSFDIDTRQWAKEGLSSETIESVRHGKTQKIIEYDPLELGKPIDGYKTPGYMVRMAQIAEPDRVVKTEYSVKGNKDNHTITDRTLWETNLDLRGNIGEVSLRDLPMQGEAQQVRMLAASGEFIIENENLVSERIINPNYNSQDTLEEMLSKLEDESLREQYRNILEERTSKQQEENKSGKTL